MTKATTRDGLWKLGPKTDRVGNDRHETGRKSRCLLALETSTENANRMLKCPGQPGERNRDQTATSMGNLDPICLPRK